MSAKMPVGSFSERTGGTKMRSFVDWRTRLAVWLVEYILFLGLGVVIVQEMYIPN